MTPHKQIVSTTFTIAGLYYGFTVIRDFDSILATQRSFFDLAPVWQANLSAAIVTLVPLAFFAVAFAVYRGAKWWVAAVPALIAVVFTLGISSTLLGAYLVLYYAVLARPDDSNRVET